MHTTHGAQPISNELPRVGLNHSEFRSDSAQAKGSLREQFMSTQKLIKLQALVGIGACAAQLALLSHHPSTVHRVRTAKAIPILPGFCPSRLGGWLQQQGSKVEPPGVFQGVLGLLCDGSTNLPDRRNENFLEHKYGRSPAAMFLFHRQRSRIKASPGLPQRAWGPRPRRGPEIGRPWEMP